MTHPPPITTTTPPQSPELHYVVQEAAEMMALDIAPDMFECPQLAAPPGSTAPPVLLVHVPHVSNASLAASFKMAGPTGRLLRLPDSTFGWRRRALLLLRPGLLDSGSGWSPLELQAMIAGAMAPMCLPGGGGWRLNAGAGGGAGAAGAGGALVAPLTASRLAVADIVTAVNLADAVPQALVGQLPSQLQVRCCQNRVVRFICGVVHLAKVLLF